MADPGACHSFQRKLAQEPHTRFICSSYADSLSIKHSLDRRTLISSQWYQELWGNRVKFSDDQNLKGEFQNDARGLMIATSTGGSITSQPAAGAFRR